MVATFFFVGRWSAIGMSEVEGGGVQELFEIGMQSTSFIESS